MRRFDDFLHLCMRECLLQSKGTALWIVLALVAASAIWSGHLMWQEALLKIKDADTMLLTSAAFSPFINSCLLLPLLTGCTVFILFGVVLLSLETGTGCISVRASHDGWSRVLLSKAVFGLAASTVAAVLCMMSGIFWQLRWNQRMSDSGFLQFPPFGLGVVPKTLCLLLMLWGSLTMGMLLGNLIRRTAWSIAAAVLLDQVVLAKTWLYEGFVFRVFSDAHMRTVGVPAVGSGSGSLTGGYLIMTVILSILVWILSLSGALVSAEEARA